MDNLTETPELTELEEAEIALNAHAQDLRAEWDKPLTFQYDTHQVEIGLKWNERWGEFEPFYRTETDPHSGKIASGILWIPPFTGPSPFPQKQKVVKPKHKCAECGASHVDRRKK